MLDLPLSRTGEEEFHKALRDPKRRVRFKMQFYSAEGEPLAYKAHLIDGTVTVDWTQRMTQPSRTAEVLIADPDGTMVIDTRSEATSSGWLKRQIGLWYGVWLPIIQEWVDVPVFRGHIFEISRDGVEVSVHATGFDGQHVEPYTFPHVYSIRRHTRYRWAIMQMFKDRDESRFDFETFPRRLPRGRSWGLAQWPWKAGQQLADDVDRMLFFDGRGRLVLRRKHTQPVWRFYENERNIVTDITERISLADVYNMVVTRGEKSVKTQIKVDTEMTEAANAGATSIKVNKSKDLQDGRKIRIGAGDNYEMNKIAGSYTQGSKTIPLAHPLKRNRKKGALVQVQYQGETTKAVIGRARLPSTHPLSAAKLTNGKRPMIFVDDAPRVGTTKRAQERAEKKMKKVEKKIEDDVSLSALVVPHLEEGDPVLIDVGGVTKSIRARRFTIPLSIDGTMEMNWIGRRLPKRRRPKKKKKGNRR